MGTNGLKRSVAGMALIGLLGMPSAAPGQECAQDGNRNTRAAEVELSWAERPGDPQAPEERYARALEKLEPAFEDNPNLARAYLLAARAYLGLRDFVGADSMFTNLVARDPACAEQVQQERFNAWVPWFNRGVAQVQSGDDAAALESFEKANQIYDDARALNNAAAIYQGRGEYDAATRLYRRALATAGDEEMVRAASINLAELMRRQGMHAEALEIYAEYSAANPDDVLGQLNYAIALMDAGEPERAQAMFSELLGRDDLSYAQWSQVGIGLYRAQDYEQASRAFAEAHSRNPYNKETLENLANAYYQAESYEALLPVADMLTDRYPYESIHYNLLANAHRELDNPEAALEVLETRDALNLEFLQAQLDSPDGNVYMVVGQVMNRSADPGTEVSVPVDLLAEDGSVLVTEMLQLTLPDPGEMSAFQLQVEVDGPVAGFQYRMAGSSGDS